MAGLEKKNIGKAVIRFIEESETKITSGDLLKHMKRTFGISRKTAGNILSDLFHNGSVSYVNEFGRTFVEKSFLTPVRLSPKVFAVPPDITFSPSSGETAVKIIRGSSFGDGRHPTTRLALRGIEIILENRDWLNNRPASRVLDIGTGSGILGIAALLLGIGSGIGIDTDPVARFEARENTRINGLSNRFSISGGPLEDLPPDTFQMVIANLRYPTLMGLGRTYFQTLSRHSAIVLSGIKVEELENLVRLYSKNGFRPEWRLVEKGWAGIVFRKN